MLSKAEFTKRLAKRLKDLRKARGISQELLAHEAQLYRTYVNHIETGRYSPSAFVVYKIANALGIKSADILPF